MKAFLRWLALAATLPLAGCNLSGNSLYGQYFQILRQTVSGTMGSSRVTRAQAAAISYASLGYTIGGGPERILVLATDANGEQLWTAASHVVLTMRAGRVLQTQRLDRNLGIVTPATGQAVPAPAEALNGPLSYQRLVDFPDIGIYGAVLACQMSQVHSENIKVLGVAISTIRITERCNAASMNWSFTDSFWVDEKNGTVWQSVQHIHPKLDPLHIELFRPPS